MGFDDFYPLSIPRHLRNQSDLEIAASQTGDFRTGIGGTRHDADVQAFGSRRWSAARSRFVDLLS